MGVIVGDGKQKGHSVALESWTRYTDYEVTTALALVKMYGSIAHVSREMGIPESTIATWWSKKDIIEERLKKANSMTVGDYQERIQSSMGFVMTEALQQIHRKIGDASAAQAATIFGILFDKQQIMLGNQAQITQNNLFIDTGGMSDEEKLMLMQRALDRKREAEILEQVPAIDSED